ncbi:MAG: MFS transporter [Planctomycetota bacterium]|nr:MFS transporter [Planctomycetota bacterium]
MRPRLALFILLLFGLNLLCYADRFIIGAVMPQVMADFELSHARGGFIITVFMIAYTASAPILGWIVDKRRTERREGVRGRTRILMVGVLAWGVFTFAAAVVGDHTLLLLGRMGSGVGQAVFAIVAPILIADCFRPEKRGPVVTFFYVAISLGSAIGYAGGGHLGTRFGWQYPLMAIGIGVLTFRLLLELIGPGRAGEPEPCGEPNLQKTNCATPGRESADPSDSAEKRSFGIAATLRALAGNRPFVLATFGMAAADFGLGGLAAWMPTFYQSTRRLSPEKATLWFGACTAVAGIVGTVLGGWLGEYFQKRGRRAPSSPQSGLRVPHPNPLPEGEGTASPLPKGEGTAYPLPEGQGTDCRGYFLVCALGLLCSLPPGLVAILAENEHVFFPALFVAEVAVFMFMGPSNTIVLNVLAPSVRTTGFAINILVMHLLGTVPVAFLVGWLWDMTGSGVVAMLLPVLSFGVGGLFFLLPQGHRDTE